MSKLLDTSRAIFAGTFLLGLNACDKPDSDQVRNQDSPEPIEYLNEINYQSAGVFTVQEDQAFSKLLKQTLDANHSSIDLPRLIEKSTHSNLPLGLRFRKRNKDMLALPMQGKGKLKTDDVVVFADLEALSWLAARSSIENNHSIFQAWEARLLSCANQTLDKLEKSCSSQLEKKMTELMKNFPSGLERSTPKKVGINALLKEIHQPRSQENSGLSLESTKLLFDVIHEVVRAENKLKGSLLSIESLSSLKSERMLPTAQDIRDLKAAIATDEGRKSLINTWNGLQEARAQSEFISACREKASIGIVGLPQSASN